MSFEEAVKREIKMLVYFSLLRLANIFLKHTILSVSENVGKRVYWYSLFGRQAWQ